MKVLGLIGFCFGSDLWVVEMSKRKGIGSTLEVVCPGQINNMSLVCFDYLYKNLDVASKKEKWWGWRIWDCYQRLLYWAAVMQNLLLICSVRLMLTFARGFDVGNTSCWDCTREQSLSVFRSAKLKGVIYCRLVCAFVSMIVTYWVLTESRVVFLYQVQYGILVAGVWCY